MGETVFESVVVFDVDSVKDFVKEIVTEEVSVSERLKEEEMVSVGVEEKDSD